MAWQWIASLGLSAVYLFGSPSFALKGWWWPGLATFALPVLLFALIFLDVQGSRLETSALPRDGRAG